MSGHSKWHNIQGRKGKQDAVKSSLFSKYSKIISIAARAGADSATNFSLRLAIEKAKAAGMPKDNIERAIKKGAGGPGEGAQVEESLYEAFGPGGAAVLVKVVTDNKNRTLQEIKHIFSDYGGALGGPGSVLWMFSQFGYIELQSSGFGAKREEMEMALIEVGAEDIAEGGEGTIEIKTKVENLKKVLDKIKELGLESKESGLIWAAKDKVAVSEEVRAKLENLFADLEENEDVEDYFTNAE